MPEQFKSLFSPVCRQRGQAYFARGAVRKLRSDASSAVFRVRGSMDYEVRLKLHGPQDMQMVCSCPFYEQGNTCKHLWAALLYSEKSRLFPQLDQVKELHLESDFDEIEESEPRRDWKTRLLELKETPRLTPVDLDKKPGNKVIHFAIDLPNSEREQKIRLEFFTQDRLRDGSLGQLKGAELGQTSFDRFPDPKDQSLLQAVLGQTELTTRYSSYSYARAASGASVQSDFATILLPRISEAGRLHLIRRESFYTQRPEPEPYTYLPQTWQLRFRAERKGENYEIRAYLASGEAERSTEDILAVVDRFVFFREGLAASDLDRKGAWLQILDSKSHFDVPVNEINSFLQLYLNSNPPEIILPAELAIQERGAAPPKVVLHFGETETAGVFGARLYFEYEGHRIRATDETSHIYLPNSRERLARHKEAEVERWQQFQRLNPAPPLRNHGRRTVDDGHFSRDMFLPAVQTAISFGWEVLADDKTVRVGGDFAVEVSSSGVDWFDVKAKMDFGSSQLSLPSLLRQLNDNENLVVLDDGTYGLLPEAWLQRLRTLGSLAKITAKDVKLSKVQALFIASLLSESENFRGDRKFESLTSIIEQLRNLKARDAEGDFRGELRSYQRFGLGWLSLLTRHQIGGILADDMGLGKTVQILALLESQRHDQATVKPHLLVAPKSLIFNWKNELAKFTPQLKALDYTSPKRHLYAKEFDKFDVVLTTYQTLRSDVESLSQFEFESFILDEAHYVKNPKSQAALACRLIKANKKLALTGTPVENSLNDIFSILTIVNPGLITPSQAQSLARDTRPQALSELSRALRPFLLRRTKDQVLKDLPPKVEQVLFCELSRAERKKYDELKAFYWSQLSDKVRDKGLQNSKIEVLEALLRLRQASCHQGLLDTKLARQPSAKFQLLLEQIGAVIQDGHKVLVFSQFTTLLGLLKPHLEEQNVRYQYLDGQTRDREQRVADFQGDPEVKVFLLSLKAGGVGLNLTAADYVFILDPWWNPAAEAQAIDRAHRIGQTKNVFSYKIIAKDTVEEKILALQNVKRDLAKSIVADDASVLKKLTLDDLRRLFT